MITMKFGFKWMFFTPNSEDYGVSAITFYQTTKRMIRKMIEEEKLDELKDLGQFQDAKILMLQTNPDYNKYFFGLKKVLGEDHVIDTFSLEKDP